MRRLNKTTEMLVPLWTDVLAMARFAFGRDPGLVIHIKCSARSWRISEIYRTLEQGPPNTRNPTRELVRYAIRLIRGLRELRCDCQPGHVGHREQCARIGAMRWELEMAGRWGVHYSMEFQDTEIPEPVQRLKEDMHDENDDTDPDVIPIRSAS